MKKVLGCLVLVCLLVLVTACGGKSNALVGTWEGKTNDGLKTTFEFKKGGDVKYSNEYGFDSEGTYEIDGNMVTINLKTWSEAKKYKFEVKDKKLSLTAQDQFSPSYKDMAKK